MPVLQLNYWDYTEFTEGLNLIKGAREWEYLRFTKRIELFKNLITGSFAKYLWWNNKSLGMQLPTGAVNWVSYQTI